MPVGLVRYACELDPAEHDDQTSLMEGAAADGAQDLEARTFNGVFKGGGAKGIAYVGALRAAHERGVRFSSVAGSSAGAITAALVAADVSVEKFEELAAEGLETVKRRILLGFIPWADRNLYDVNHLEAWLDGVLHEKVTKRVAGPVHCPVTFQQLYDATGIELNVVAMDLHRRQPVVFNYELTPSVGVAPAVMASSAIPVAMPPGRILVRRGASSTVHRLVDGGAWANYPAFVYTDASFRAFFGLDPLVDGRWALFLTRSLQMRRSVLLKPLGCWAVRDGRRILDQACSQGSLEQC